MSLAEPSWQCIHFADEAPAIPDGVAVRAIDATSATKEDLLASIAESLSLPEWFGGNWDALSDTLRDLSWLDTEASLVLVAEGAGVLWREAPEVAATLVEIWLGAAGSWADRDTGFHLVFVW